MLGKIFTEFLDLVEEQFGYEMVDKILIESDVPSQGSYTSVGTYSHDELISLVIKLSEAVDVPTKELMIIFGQVMFRRLVGGHPEIINNIDDSFELLSHIDDYIHVEVLKLYPNAQLPKFSFEQISASQVILTYQSSRPLASFAQGLLMGCGQYFDEEFAIQRESKSDNSETDVVFVINRAKKECDYA
jgi:hypothetical protein